MIKLFSLNHTRIRRFSILAQDKTHISTSRCLDICCQMVSASAHTNYLVNLLKSSEPELIKAAYSTSTRDLVNGYFLIPRSVASAHSQPKNLNTYNRLNLLSIPPHWRSLSKWGAFYSDQLSCQRPFSTFFIVSRFARKGPFKHQPNRALFNRFFGMPAFLTSYEHATRPGNPATRPAQLHNRPFL